MSAVDIDALEALDASAMAVPWVCGKARKDGTCEVYRPNVGPCRVIAPVAETAPPQGELIVAMRNALPSILAELRVARAVLSLCPREAEWSPEETFCEAVRAYDAAVGEVPR